MILRHLQNNIGKNCSSNSENSAVYSILPLIYVALHGFKIPLAFKSRKGGDRFYLFAKNMEQFIDNSPAEPGEIIDCRVYSFGNFAAVYTLSEKESMFELGVTLVDPEGNLEDRIFIPNLTPNEAEARSMLECLYNGNVTPCTVTDVLEDMIGI